MAGERGHEPCRAALAGEDEPARVASSTPSPPPSTDDPLVSPPTADLSGLPPLLIQVATGDEWCVDGQELAARACEHGVDARLELYPVGTHVFHVFWSFLPEASEALESAGRFTREVRGTAIRAAS